MSKIAEELPSFDGTQQPTIFNSNVIKDAL